jgi:hypothetical protein
VVDDLDRDSPLRIIYVWEMLVLLCQNLDFSEDFLIIELAVVSAAKMQHPTLDLLGLAMSEKQFIQFLKHSEVLSPESFFHWQDTMAVSADCSPLLVDLFHHQAHDYQGIDLFVGRVDLDKAQTLRLKGVTLTLVSTWLSIRISFFLLCFTSFSRESSLPSAFIFLRMFSSVMSL